MLRLAVGVALVPVGALVTLTADRPENEHENGYTKPMRKKKVTEHFYTGLNT